MTLCIFIQQSTVSKLISNSDIFNYTVVNNIRVINEIGTNSQSAIDFTEINIMQWGNIGKLNKQFPNATIPFDNII